MEQAQAAGHTEDIAMVEAEVVEITGGESEKTPHQWANHWQKEIGAALKRLNRV